MPELHPPRARAALEDALGRALEGDELRVHYQPEVLLSTGQVVGAEALLRWQHPERGLIGPGEFFPVAESAGLLVAIGAWALQEACRQAAAWQDETPESPVTVAVNLAAAQVVAPDLVDIVAGALEHSRLDPAMLCLEINESVLMRDAEASVRLLRALKALGVRLAVDDFGTGYSSLSYLKRFPVDFLKVDRSFVAGLGSDPEDTAVVGAIVGLAHNLGLRVVAEGVETERQLDELRRLGCSYAQGYHWSAPLRADEIGRLLADRHSSAEAGGRPAPALEPAGPASASDETAVQALDEAVSMLTHELRTPLAVMSGYGELLAEVADESGDLRRQAADAIGRAAASMGRIIDSLVDVRALDAGTLQLRRERHDLVDLVQRVVHDVRPTLGHDVVVTAPPPGLVPATVDVPRFTQVLTNLLTNAAKFSPEGAPIDVLVRVDGGEASVHVVDRGPGIPPERIGDVFRKFSRLDRSKKGTGLGLFISRGIARAHGGDLSCRRAATGGAELVLVLPVLEEGESLRAGVGS